MQEYVTIKQARAMLEASRAGTPLERTVAGYEAKTGRMFIVLARVLGSMS